MTVRLRGMLDLPTLEALVDSGDIDTVLVVFPDLQGRFLGKRVMGHFFCDQVAHHGTENCNYLLALDVDMTPLPGYRYANWELGYGDFRAVPDLATLRVVPWLDRTALVICDLVDTASDAPVEVSPRQILRRQVERARAAGYAVMIGSEVEFFLFRESYEEAAAKGYRGLTPHAHYIEDYHIFQTTKDEYLIRQIRNGLDAAGVPVEFSKGEAGHGQHEINLRYADALTMADRHTVYKNGAKEIAALNGRAITFMAKYDMAEVGSSCHVHSSLWSSDGRTPRAHHEHGPHHLSDEFRWYIGGLVATAGELAWCFAPYVNSYKRYQPGSWAPTALSWAVDNRTVGFRLVGHGPSSLRIESRIPGADANPYLAFAATIAGGLWGIEHRIEPPPPYAGNGYTARDVDRIPATIVDAVAGLAASEVARSAFGDEVHHHLVNTAEQEWRSANQVVTDWELRRNFEQI